MIRYAIKPQPDVIICDIKEKEKMNFNVFIFFLSICIETIVKSIVHVEFHKEFDQTSKRLWFPNWRFPVWISG